MQRPGDPQSCSDSVLLVRTWAERLKRSREDYFTEPPVESTVAPAFHRRKLRDSRRTEISVSESECSQNSQVVGDSQTSQTLKCII